MSEVRYTDQHEWISLDGDEATVGITKYAAESLGDVVFVELPPLAKTVTAGGEAAVVESVKAASDVFAPASGEVVAVNAKLADSPSLVNEDAQGAGWLFKLNLSAPEELDGLMDDAAYADYLKTIG